MKLYDVPNNSRIKVDGLVLTFHHLDGMFSHCTDDQGKVHHLAAWTDVEVI